MGKQNNPQQGQKRKADDQSSQAPKQQKTGGAAQQQGQGKKPQQQQGGKPQQAKQGGAPKAAAKKAPEPEPESEDDEEDEEGAGGEVDEAALKLIDGVEKAAEAINDELDQFDAQMNKEIYAIQKKYLQKKKPLISKRDNLLAEKLPGMWSKLLQEHDTFAAQLDDIDREILESLSKVEVDEQYSGDQAEKQQIVGVNIVFTFRAGSKLVKAGRFTKQFKFDDVKETLLAVPAKDLPFASATFAKDNVNSFFAAWFAAEGEDDGILAAQDALSSELYVDPLQLYKAASQGMDINGGADDEDDDAMAFGGEDSDDDEAPQLVDEE